MRPRMRRKSPLWNSFRSNSKSKTKLPHLRQPNPQHRHQQSPPPPLPRNLANKSYLFPGHITFQGRFVSPAKRPSSFPPKITDFTSGFPQTSVTEKKRGIPETFGTAPLLEKTLPYNAGYFLDAFRLVKGVVLADWATFAGFSAAGALSSGESALAVVLRPALAGRSVLSNSNPTLPVFALRTR